MKRAPKVWPRITIEIASEAAELVEAALLEAGSLGNVTEDDETRAIPEHSYENTGISKISATFEDGSEIRAQVESLVGDYLSTLTPCPDFSLSWDTLLEENWDAIFKASWKSLDLGCGVFIVPSWEKDNFTRPADAKAVIYLDPGMAFGTGHHETTTLCAQALVSHFEKANPNYQPKVLDVGTGTAILAIVAAQLGAIHVTGTEICDDALVAAEENAAGNNLADRISIYNNEPHSFGAVFDLVVANILAQPLIELAPQILAAMKPQATLILSGILATQAAGVQAAYEKLGLKHRQTNHKGDWVVIIFG